MLVVCVRFRTIFVRFRTVSLGYFIYVYLDNQEVKVWHVF